MKTLRLLLLGLSCAWFMVSCMSAVETGDVPRDSVTIGKKQAADPKTDSLQVLEKKVKTEIK